MDINNTKELIDAIKLVGLNSKKAFADGKIAFTDFQYLIDIAVNSEKLIKALDGINEVPKEVKDINAVEAQELVAYLLLAFSEIKSA